MAPVLVQGLGYISRHAACCIEICDEMGTEGMFTAKQAVHQFQTKGIKYTPKEIRQAIYSLSTKTEGPLERTGLGTFRWKPIESEMTDLTSENPDSV